MKTEKIITEKTVLILEDYEKQWLKSLMQNPIFVDNPANEDPEDKLIRKAFWNALNED